MESAIFLIVFILGVLLILPIIFSISTNNKVKELKEELFLIRRALDALKDLSTPSPDISSEKTIESKIVIEEKPFEQLFVHEAIPAPVVIQEEVSNTTIEDIIEPLSITDIEDSETFEEKEEVVYSEPEPFKPFEVSKPKSDIERFIGEKLLSLIGIGVFVLGIFFLVKWAIDQQLINNVGKVSIGLFSGMLLIGTAHIIRINFRTFSSILVGGGLAVFYFTVYIAFQDYHLLSQTPAFIVMVAITIFAVILAIVYDKVELAIIAIIGGFTTPFWVSTGEGNYVVLFSYLLILNIGMYFLASFKRWNLVNIVSYIFTILIFGGWMISKFNVNEGHAKGGLIFASLFYSIFFGMNLTYNLRNHEKFRPIEISLLLSNTFLFYAAGIYCLNFIHNGQFQGVFTVVLGAINFAVAFLLYKKEHVDKNLVYLLIGLVLTFVSLTGPIQLEGNYITLFWATEMVLVLWLGEKTGIKIVKETTILLMILCIASLVMDWTKIYSSYTPIAIIMNKAFLSGIFVTVAFFLKGFLLKRDNKDFWTLSISQYTKIIQIVSLLIAYLVVLLELIFQLNSRLHSNMVTANYVYMYHYLFVLILLMVAIRLNQKALTTILMFIGSLLIALYFVFNYSIIDLRASYFAELISSGIYLSHFINAALALTLLYIIGKYVVKQFGLRTPMSARYAWFAVITLVIILSIEIIHIWVVLNHKPGFEIYHDITTGFKICLPILWGVSSFVIMARGMHQKLKTLRIISLTLFSITLLKLFIYDIANASQGGKIAAFISLGVLLLVVSFMYQKLKGMLIDGPSKDERENQN